MSRWSTADIPDQTGRTVLVTGATSGLGLRTAIVLAQRGATVLMTCRDRDRGQLALDRLRQCTADADAALITLDLADLTSVHRAADEVRARTGDQLDVLMNNAGVMATPLHRTVDGFELHRRASAAGRDLLAVAVHPGFVDTELVPNSVRMRTRLLTRVSKWGYRLIAQSVARGASAQLYAATAADARSGAYYGPTSLGETRGPVGPARISPVACDERVAGQLRERTAALTGVPPTPRRLWACEQRAGTRLRAAGQRWPQAAATGGPQQPDTHRAQTVMDPYPRDHGAGLP